MKKVEKKILVSIILFVFLFSLLGFQYQAKASSEPIKVGIDTQEKISAYEGTVISFDLKYDILDPKAVKSGYKLTIKLPDVLKDVKPEYPKIHFDNMTQDNGVVTLYFKDAALWGEDNPLTGYIRIWATIGEVKETKLYPVTVSVGTYTETFEIEAKDIESVSGGGSATGYPKLSKGATLSYDNKGNYIIEDISKPVEYYLCVNYDKVLLNGVQVKDTLPVGMELIEDSIRVEEFSNNNSDRREIKPSGNISKNGFNIALGNINKTYYIYYKVNIVSQQSEYKNNAEIAYNSTTEKSSANAKIKTGAGAINVKKVVDKQVVNVGEDQTVKYKISFSSFGDFPMNSIKFEDVVDSRLKVKAVSSTNQFTVNQEDNTIKAVNDKKGIVAGEECFIEIIADMTDVKAGETVKNVALVNGAKTNEVTTKKTYIAEILKYDSKDKAIVLENAEFEVKDSKGTVVSKVITDKYGKATFSLDNVGDYSLKEVKAPEGYELLKDEIPFTVETDFKGVKLIEVQNSKATVEVKKYQVDILKYDSSNKNVVLKDAKFQIKDSSGTVVATVITDELGKASISLDKPGNYTLKEVEAPKGYELNKDEIAFIVEEADSTIKLLEVKNSKLSIPPTNPTVDPKPPTDPKVDPKPPTDPKVDPKPPTDPKVDPKPPTDPKVDPKPPTDPKVDPKPPTDPKVDPKPSIDPKVDPKPTTDPKVDPKPPIDLNIDIDDGLVVVNKDIERESKESNKLVNENLKPSVKEKSEINQLPQTGGMIDTQTLQILGSILMILGIKLAKRK